jgi:hypothetical protein
MASARSHKPIHACDNAAMENFFSLLKTVRATARNDGTKKNARADAFDDIEQFSKLTFVPCLRRVIGRNGASEC